MVTCRDLSLLPSLPLHLLLGGDDAYKVQIASEIRLDLERFLMQKVLHILFRYNSKQYSRGKVLKVN